MASGNDRAAVVSGADLGDAARRRNVPGASQPVPVPVPAPQPDDKKAKKKVGARASPGSRCNLQTTMAMPIGPTGSVGIIGRSLRY